MIILMRCEATIPFLQINWEAMVEVYHSMGNLALPSGRHRTPKSFHEEAFHLGMFLEQSPNRFVVAS